MPSNSLRALLALALCAVAAGPALAAEQPSRSLCRADESVFFSCPAGAKTVSLCGAKASGAIETLIYRFGVAGRIEKEFRASHENRNRFTGFVAPANPGALVRQVWFDDGPFRYLLSQCVGGDCSQPAGIAVLRGGALVMNAACAPKPGNDLAWFSDELVEFGSDIDVSRSKTDLLQLDAFDNPIEKIYRTRRRY